MNEKNIEQDDKVYMALGKAFVALSLSRFEEKIKNKSQNVNNSILEIAKLKTQECNTWFNTHQNEHQCQTSTIHMNGKKHELS